MKSNSRHSQFSQVMEGAKSDGCRKSNSFQNIGTIKSNVSWTFYSYPQSRGTDTSMD